MKKLLILILITSIFYGCENNQEDNVDIAVSSYALKFIVDEIAPDSLNVIKIDEKNTTQASHAKLTMYISNEYKGSLNDIANSIEIYPLLYSNIDNPNFFISPNQMIIASEVVYSQILNVFPDFKDELQKNYIELFEKLDDLDKQYENIFKDAGDEVFVTNDDSFAHLQDYNFNYITYDDYLETSDVNINKVLCNSATQCNFFENDLFKDSQILEYLNLTYKPVNGNYFSAQYKNVLILENLVNQN
ncbi:MAG: metal ABC transporter solute-binding protein, Zn/Mn family [Bacilli bacterium]